jgi:hypothetical protein
MSASTSDLTLLAGLAVLILVSAIVIAVRAARAEIRSRR